jgi:hypothetical protein
MSSIPINHTFTETMTITSMKIEITQLILFTSCQFRVIFLDQDETPVKCQILTMSGVDYQSWEANDQYVIQWVKSQLEIN